VKNGKRASLLPYFHWIFPYAKFRQSGDRVIENGMLASTFEGYGLGNGNFAAGADGRWEFPVAAERPYAYARTDWAPQGLQGFYTWSDEEPAQQVYFTKSGIQGATSVSVSTLTANGTVATITFSGSGHGLATNDVVIVSGAGDAFNTGSAGVAITVDGSTATYTVPTVGSTEISATLDKFTRVTVADSVTEELTAARYTAVTSADIDTKYANTNSISNFNVPGNVNYNSDANVDFIIKSNEDV